MLNKKLMILTIILTCLLAVSAVSAAENATEDIVSADASEDSVSVEETTDEVVIVDDNQIISKQSENDTNYLSFWNGENILTGGSESDLKTAISNTPSSGTLLLSQDYYYYSSDSEGIVINKKITIDGNGHYINVGQGSRIFKITGGSVILKNINFYSGKYADSSSSSEQENKDGGAIYWVGNNGKCINCNFYNNQAGEFGGAIYWTGSNGLIDNCYFSGNKATGIWASGGAIYWTGSNGLINNSRFYNNFANSGGGAISNYRGQDCNIQYCTFNDNYANSDGGAIEWNGLNGNIFNCYFNRNYVDDYSSGGAITIGMDSVNIKFCNFNKNHAIYNGGAISNWGDDANIINCKFYNNYVTMNNGGAILSNGKNVKIEKSIFNNNSAKNGGALCLYEVSKNIIKDSSFNKNIAQNGSEIFWDNAICSITNTSFNGKKSDYNEFFGIYKKINPKVTSNIKNIVYKQVLNANIALNKNMGGNLSIKLFDNQNNLLFSEINNISFLNYTFNYIIPNLMPGLYSFDIAYSGDNVNNYYHSVVNVNVFKLESKINFDVENINWGDSVNINPTVSDNATGFIEIYVNNEYINQISIGNNYTLFNVGGPYSDITLIYMGDDYYNSSTCTKRIYVTRLDSICNIRGNIEVDNSATVYVTLNEDATGKVSITVKGTKYTSNLINGVATFRVPSLAAGTYSVTIGYEGDSKYNSIYTTKTLEVTLKPSTITLNVKNILTGNNLVIKPIVTSSASGNLKIYVDNVLKKTIAIGSSYTIENPTIGSHSVRVVYAGDSYHQGNETKTTFRVFTFYPIEVQNSAIIYGMDKHFQAIVYDEYGNVAANKPVAFSINGEDTVVMADSNGLAVFNKDLPIGTYYVSVVNVYVNEEHTYILKVFTSIESENMTRAYNTGMDFKVKLLDENADTLSRGYALFNVNNKDYPVVADNNGIAVLNGNLPVGTYTVTTTNGRTGETKTNKITIVPSVEATNMVRGYNSGVDFKAKFLDADAKPLINQKVAFKIGSIEYEATTDANGFAVLNEQLDVGKYEVTIINKVTGERAVRNLTIVGRIVENNDVIHIYGEESYYTIRVIGDDGNFAGENEVVNITINNIDYQIKTDKNAFASFRIDTNIGLYDIFAEYKGYGVYNKVYVLQRVNYINFDVNDINYKQNALVNLNLSSFDGNAFVEFEIVGDNGYEGVFDQSARTSITLPVTGLNAGKYNITAKYYDLKTYKFSSAVKTFNVNKIDPKIIVVVEDVNVGETATITVNIPDVEGNVEIKVGNALTFNEYLVKNGVIIKEVESLPAGVYNVDVTFKGNNNYNLLTQSTTLTIIQPRILTNIVASDLTVIQGKQAYLIATLKDSSGNILVGKGVSIFFNGINSILSTDNNGQVKLSIANNLVANTYTATITFVGDEDYVESTTAVKVTVIDQVSKITLTLKKVKVKKSAKKLTLQATLKKGNAPIAGVKITFKFNGKKYTAKTNAKGVAKATIKSKVLKKLKVGKKVKYQASYDNIIVKKTVKVKK